MDVEQIEFEVDGQKLKGRIYKPLLAKDLALLFIHGWTGRPNDTAAQVLARNGFFAMTFSLSGHNDSEGDISSLTIADFVEDTQAAYDFFRTKTGSHKSIGMVGSSFGSYLAVMLTSHRPISCLSLRVPANYKDEDFHASKMTRSGSDNPEVVEWRQSKLASAQNKALAALHSFAGNIQIIEAEKDTVVPHQTVQNYIDAISDKKQLEYALMKGWPHSLGDHEQRNKQFQQILLSWVKRQAQ